MEHSHRGIVRDGKGGASRVSGMAITVADYVVSDVPLLVLKQWHAAGDLHCLSTSSGTPAGVNVARHARILLAAIRRTV
jgi:hypothetical protein